MSQPPHLDQATSGQLHRRAEVALEAECMTACHGRPQLDLDAIRREMALGAKRWAERILDRLASSQPPPFVPAPPEHHEPEPPERWPESSAPWFRPPNGDGRR